MSRSGLGKPDPHLEGVELLFHQIGGSASFGAKMVLSLNGVDLSCMNSITGSTCRAKRSNILHDTINYCRKKVLQKMPRIQFEVNKSFFSSKSVD